MITILFLAILLAVNALLTILNYLDESYKQAIFHSFAFGFILVALIYETANYLHPFCSL